jgi:hypothetical protein
MEFKIPRKLGIKHVKAFNHIYDKDYVGIKDKIKVVSLFAGVHEDVLVKYNANDIQEAYIKILDKFNKYRQKELPLTISYNGVKYNLVDEFSKIPIKWYIDVSVSYFKENPELLPAFCYIEDGFDYAHLGKHDNIDNLLKDRAKVFYDNMPLDLFLDISSFFLLKFQQYKKAYSTIQKQREKLKKESRMNGR